MVGRKACARNGAMMKAPRQRRRIAPRWWAGWTAHGPRSMRSGPDFVLLWGDDQYENFREDIIPPYCVAAYEKFTFSPRADNVWGETNKTYELPGNRKA